VLVPAARDYAAITSGVRAVLEDITRRPIGARRARGRHTAREGSAAQVPEAIRIWLEHPFRLDRSVRSLQFRPQDLRVEEAMGLAILREQRERFKATHFRCKCGAVLPNTAGWCSACGEGFKAK
jgi:hypothetical protein